jgi:hypothetical protein
MTLSIPYPVMLVIYMLAGFTVGADLSVPW